MKLSEVPKRAILVVPCFDEEYRLDAGAFASFVAQNADVGLLFVNDGSRDNTLAILRRIEAAAPRQVEVLDLLVNGGKADAVRRGLLAALGHKPRFVGYWDADLATPLAAATDFLEILNDRPDIDIVTGARVMLLGRTIQRSPVRHYLGRVFATAASIVLDLPIYDTQCGAKLFRTLPQSAELLAHPFLSRWVFDVELIARYGSIPGRAYSPIALRNRIYECPLREWADVTGSKVRPGDFVHALLDLARIYWAYMRPGHPVRVSPEPAAEGAWTR